MVSQQQNRGKDISPDCRKERTFSNVRKLGKAVQRAPSSEGQRIKRGGGGNNFQRDSGSLIIEGGKPDRGSVTERGNECDQEEKAPSLKRKKR